MLRAIIVTLAIAAVIAGVVIIGMGGGSNCTIDVVNVDGEQHQVMTCR